MWIKKKMMPQNGKEREEKMFQLKKKARSVMKIHPTRL